MMKPLDRIINEITAEARAEAGRLIADAKEEAVKIKNHALSDAAEIEAEGEKKADEEYRRIIERAESAAKVSESRAALSEKQKIIGELISAAKEKAEELPTDEYFSLMLRLLDRYAAEKKHGEIILSEGDYDRITPPFKNALRKRKLHISDRTGDFKIGFILVYGDIEENCTLDALVEAEHERLSERVAEFMFGGREG